MSCAGEQAPDHITIGAILALINAIFNADKNPRRKSKFRYLRARGVCSPEAGEKEGRGGGEGRREREERFLALPRATTIAPGSPPAPLGPQWHGDCLVAIECGIQRRSRLLSAHPVRAGWGRSMVSGCHHGSCGYGVDPAASRMQSGSADHSRSPTLILPQSGLPSMNYCLVLLVARD